MYVSPKQKRQRIIWFVILLSLVPIILAGFYFIRDWRSKASVTATPQEIKISDITESSAVISWVTSDLATEGWIQYSDQSDVGDGSQIVQDLRDVNEGSTQKRTTHYVTLSALSPGATYYFVIGSGATTYKDEQEQVFDFTTPVNSMAYNALDPIRGSVSNGTNESCLVYVTLSNGTDRSFPTAVLTNDTGGFSAYLANIRDITLEAGFEYNDETDVTVFAQGGDKGGAVYKTTVGDAINGDPISMTMDLGYSVTDVFADASNLEVSDPGVVDVDTEPEDTSAESDSSSIPEVAEEESSESDLVEEQQTDETELIEEEIEEVESSPPVARVDIPLTPLILGSAVTTGISNIRVTNVTENSFTVLWSSSSNEEGYISYGTTTSNMIEQGLDDRDSILGVSSYYMHHVSALDLTPETTYYYVIYSGGNEYNNDGVPYQITMPATQSSPPEYRAMLGEITGSGSADVVITGKVSGSSGESSEVSTIVDENGRWTMSIGGVRSQDYSGYFDYVDTDSIVVTAMTRGDQESGTYTIGGIDDEVVSFELEMISTEEDALAHDGFDRGLYDVIAEVMSSLPETAINGLTAIGLTISILMIGYGSILLYGFYSGEKYKRWEENVMRDLDI